MIRVAVISGIAYLIATLLFFIFLERDDRNGSIPSGWRVNLVVAFLWPLAIYFAITRPTNNSQREDIQ